MGAASQALTANGARRLRAALNVAWEAATLAARERAALAELVACPRDRARLKVMAAFSRAHASRLLQHVVSLGRGPMPIPGDEPPVDAHHHRALRAAAARARVSAKRLGEYAELARQQADLYSAWVCELNRTEEEDAARELLGMAAAMEGR